MIYNPLGTSDLKISEVSFGCMSLGDDHAANKKLLHYAVDHGINYFDTADVYQRGFNEESVGKAFQEQREKVIIATKVGNQWRDDGNGFNWNPRKDYILKSVEGSLKRLNTHYIDLYQLHGGTIDDPIDETIEAFEILRAQGKIRYYGISSIRPNVIHEYVNRSGIVSVMMQYSLLDRRPEETCLRLLKKNNVGVLTRGTLAGGLLVDKPAKEYLGYDSESVRRIINVMDSMTDSNRTRSDIAIQFALQHSSVTSTVIGIRTLSQLKECIQATHVKRLAPNEYDSLLNALEPNLYKEHR